MTWLAPDSAWEATREEALTGPDIYSGDWPDPADFHTLARHTPGSTSAAHVGVLAAENAPRPAAALSSMTPAAGRASTTNVNGARRSPGPE